MRFRYILLTMYILLLYCPAVNSQDLKKDWEAMNAFYQQSPYLTVRVKVHAWQKGNVKPLLLQQATIYRKGQNYFYDMKDTKMLLSENAMMMVKQQEKDILLQELKPGEYEQYMKKQIAFNIDTLLSKYDSAVYHGQKEGNKVYHIYTSKSLIQMTEVYLDPSNYGLSRIIYHYDEKRSGYPKVEMNFVNNSDPFSEHILSTDQYLVRKEDQYQLQSAYSSYHLIITNHEE